jgi:hypothetical protein
MALNFSQISGAFEETKEILGRLYQLGRNGSHQAARNAFFC